MENISCKKRRIRYGKIAKKNEKRQDLKKKEKKQVLHKNKQ